MPAIAMSPTLSPKEVFENYGLKPNHLALSLIHISEPTRRS